MFAEAGTDHLIGVVLGGAYQLVGRIGQGGMGVVYEAHHLRLHNRVAVKLMNRANASHQEALTRFHREALLASRLGHPHLVNVSDFGTSEDGQPYMVMEFLEGEDLDHRMQRAGRVPLQSAIHIARQTASAVAAVHAKGIVHRDLKPANIFLVHVAGEADFVKVLDFGVSKIRAARTKITDAARIIGTPEYMSPEQVAGSAGAIDHRTDQWALACIVWEMLAGRLPFTAEDADAVFYQLRNLQPPPLGEFVADLPPTLEPVLLRALSKRPADRFPSIREFARGLETAVANTWVELIPVEADPTIIEPTIVEALPEAASESPGPSGLLSGLTALASTVGLSEKSRTTAVHDPQRASQRAARLRAIFAVLVVTMAGALGGLLFAGGRRDASAASPTIQATASSPPLADPPAMPLRPEGIMQLQPGAADQSSTSPSKSRTMVRTQAPLAAPPKHAREHARSMTNGRARLPRSQRLTMDDF